MPRKILSFLLILSLIGFASVSQAQSNELADNITEYLSRLEGVGYSGSVMVVQDGEILVNEGYGLANIETGEANTADTIFTIGSVTKLFTAVSILQLHEAGLLDVNAPISDYLPDVPEDKADISIEQIINMEGGLETYHGNGDFDPMSRDEALEEILHTPLYAEPGTEYNYSNSGYTLLAILIELLSGQTYEDYIREHILEPLDMERTGFRGEPFDNIAYTNNVFDGYGTSIDWDYSWALVGNGGMVASNADLYRFMQALLNYELVSPETMQHWVDFSEVEGWTASAGGGSATDFNSAINMNIQEGIFILNMTNDIRFAGEFVNQFLELLVEGEEVALAPDVIPLPDSDTLNTYTGDYQLETGGIISILSSENGLSVSANGQDAVNALIPTTRDGIYERFEELNDATEDFLTPISEGDFETFADAFDIGITASNIERFWNSQIEDRGAFESATVVGTSISSFGLQELTTVMEFVFEDEPAYLQVWWNENNQLVGITVTEQPDLLVQELFPTDEAEFMPFNIFVSNTPTLIFNADGSLTVSSINGDVMANRIE